MLVINLSFSFIIDASNPMGTSLNSEIARRSLIQFTNTIVESNIDPIGLVRRLYSKEVISESIYRRMRDISTNEERLEKILDGLKDHIECDTNAFNIFLDVLNDLSQKDLAAKIMAKYKGIVCCSVLHGVNSVLELEGSVQRRQE